MTDVTHEPAYAHTTAAFARRVALAPPPGGPLQDLVISYNYTGNSLQTVVCLDDSGEHRRVCIVSSSFRSNSVLGHSVAMVYMQGHRQVISRTDNSVSPTQHRL